MVNINVTLPEWVRDEYKDQLRKFLTNRLGTIVKYNKAQSETQNKNIYSVKYDDVPRELFWFMKNNNIREVTYENDLRLAEPYEINAKKYNL